MGVLYLFLLSRVTNQINKGINSFSLQIIQRLSFFTERDEEMWLSPGFYPLDGDFAYSNVKHREP